MDECKYLEFLDDKAEKLLEKQINSDKTSGFKANSLIAINSILVPIFLFIIENSNHILSILSIIPIFFFCYSIILMINVMKPIQLFVSFNEDQFDKLVKDEYNDILLYDISAKIKSIKNNEEKIKKRNKILNKGLNCTLIGIISSFIMIFIKIVGHF